MHKMLGFMGQPTVANHFITSMIALLYLLVLSVVVFGWESDDRCRDQRERRAQKVVSVSADTKRDTESQLLREGNRNLGQPQEHLVFQVKLHWEEGYCWQDEWIERRYCWKCIGNFCNEGDRVEIFECNETSPIQKWVYYPESNKRGRMSPESNPDLCLEQQDNITWNLQWCNSTDTNQLLWGWKIKKPFELFPIGQRERCFSQHHDPKDGEVVYAELCDDARDDFTSLWEVYNPEGTQVSRSMEWSPPPSCVLSLGMVSEDSIVPGLSIISPDNDTLSLQQWDNGTLAVMENGAMLWKSRDFLLDEQGGEYTTVLQGDGNLITWKNETGAELQVGWKSGATGAVSTPYFLGIDCSYEYIGVYHGTPDNPGKILWSGETVRLGQ